MKTYLDYIINSIYNKTTEIRTKSIYHTSKKPSNEDMQLLINAVSKDVIEIEHWDMKVKTEYIIQRQVYITEVYYTTKRKNH